MAKLKLIDGILDTGYGILDTGYTARRRVGTGCGIWDTGYETPLLESMLVKLIRLDTRCWIFTISKMLHCSETPAATTRSTNTL